MAGKRLVSSILNLELSNGNLLKSLFNLNLPENLYKDVFSSDELSKKTFSYAHQKGQYRHQSMMLL